MSSTESFHDEIKPHRMPDDFGPWPPPEKRGVAQKIIIFLFDRPVTWFREKFVLPGRAGNVYYHRKFLRVPTVDECYTDDILCIWEANQQWKRDRKVDQLIVEILKSRFEHCVDYYMREKSYEACEGLQKEYEDALNAHFIKHGDLGANATARDVYFKQVHRMIMERREALAKEARQQANA